MSKDKHRSRDRRLALLQLALDSEARGAAGIACNCHGGLPLANRDAKRLVKEGALKVQRIPYPSLSGYSLRRTYLVLTDKGRGMVSA